MTRRRKWLDGGTTVSVYITAEQAQFLRRAARAEETTMSDIVRRAFRRYFFLPEDISRSNIDKTTSTTEVVA